MTRDMRGVEVARQSEKRNGRGSVSWSIKDVGEKEFASYVQVTAPFYSTSHRAAVYPLFGLRADRFVVKVSLRDAQAVSREFYRMPPNFRYRYKLCREAMFSRFAGHNNLAEFFELGRSISVLIDRVGSGPSGAYRLLTVLRGAAFELKEVHKPRDVVDESGRIVQDVCYVHHDIKPSNFVVNRKDKVTLLDWELTVKAGASYSLISVKQQRIMAEKKQAFSHCGPERFQKEDKGLSEAVARCEDDMYGFAEMLAKTLKFIEGDASCCDLYHKINVLLANLILMCQSDDLGERPTAELLYTSLSAMRRECLASFSKPISIPVVSGARSRTRTLSGGESPIKALLSRSGGGGDRFRSSSREAGSFSRGLFFSPPRLLDSLSHDKGDFSKSKLRATVPFVIEKEAFSKSNTVQPLSLLFSALHSPVSSIEGSDDCTPARSYSDSYVSGSDSSKASTPL